MVDGHAIVFIVDDDVSVRESLELLIRNEGWRARDIRVRAGIPQPPANVCSELSCARPFASGPQRSRTAEALAAERLDMPIIFITGHGDVPKTVQAMKAGAVEFLTKPSE